MKRPSIVQSTLKFQCPFCGHGAATSERPAAVFHELPQCEKFSRLSPDRYLKAVREALKIMGRVLG